jgi:hypothetical protein
MLLSGGRPTQARQKFSSMARCLDRALTTGTPWGWGVGVWARGGREEGMS